MAYRPPTRDEVETLFVNAYANYVPRVSNKDPMVIIAFGSITELHFEFKVHSAGHTICVSLTNADYNVFSVEHNSIDAIISSMHYLFSKEHTTRKIMGEI